MVRAEGCQLVLECIGALPSSLLSADTLAALQAVPAAEIQAVLEASSVAAVYGSAGEEFLRDDMPLVQHNEHSAHPDCE